MLYTKLYHIWFGHIKLSNDNPIRSKINNFGCLSGRPWLAMLADIPRIDIAFCGRLILPMDNWAWVPWAASRWWHGWPLFTPTEMNSPILYRFPCFFISKVKLGQHHHEDQKRIAQKMQPQKSIHCSSESMSFWRWNCAGWTWDTNFQDWWLIGIYCSPSFHTQKVPPPSLSSEMLIMHVVCYSCEPICLIHQDRVQAMCTDNCKSHSLNTDVG